MNEQIYISQLLQKRLMVAKEKNPQLSLRAFAKKLKLGSGSLSEILNGSRRISKKLAVQICHELALDPQERMDVLSRFPNKRPYNKTPLEVPDAQTSPQQYLRLSTDQFHVLSDGIHFALLNLMQIKGFKPDPVWIARRLKTTVSEVGKAISRLERLLLIEFDSQAKSWRRTAGALRTSDDIADLSVKKWHRESLEKADRALSEVPISRRDFSGMTMAIDVSKLAQAKELARKFQDDLAALLESGERNEVYQFNMQLFPLTQSEEI